MLILSYADVIVGFLWHDWHDLILSVEYAEPNLESCWFRIPEACRSLTFGAPNPLALAYNAPASEPSISVESLCADNSRLPSADLPWQTAKRDRRI